MSASPVYSLASTQDDDVASIEWGVSTAASYNTEDESALLCWSSAITPPEAYDDDVSERAARKSHSSPHHAHDDDDDTVEVARRDATVSRRSIGEEFTARVHEMLHESKAALKADRALDSDDEEEEEKEAEPRQDSEEEGVVTALEIGAKESAPAAAVAATPRRVQSVSASRIRASGGQLPQPPTPRPTGARMRVPGLAAPHPPPFFGAHPPPGHRSMYGSFAPGPFGPLGYGGPSMRPFNSLVPPVGPLPPHLSAGGLGRPLHLGGGVLPPRAYMGGGPPASLGAGAGGRGIFGGPGGARPGIGGYPHFGHHPHPPPAPYHLYHHQQQQHAFSPPSSVVAAERRQTSTRRDSDAASPRGGPPSAVSTQSSVSPRTAPASLERPTYRNGQSGGQAAAREPPTMASLGIGHAATSSMMAASSLGAGAELTPYPLVYVSPSGAISCVLNHDIVVEMAVDRSVRIVLHDNFAAFCNARGTSSAILHPTARILHTEDYVYTKFIANNEKMAVFGEQGVLFTMSHLSEAYLVNSSAYPGASAVALDQLQFPTMDDDYTIKMFYTEAQTGQQFIALCKDIVSEATYDRRPDGSLYLHINGMLIRQSTAGDVIIDARPRQISCSPSKKSVHVRSGCIDMAVEEEDRGYVKRAHKRVHVSRSGMVISDGNCITSMDHFGRIVCCN